MKKKALLIGINYIGTQNELRGCINDAINMKNFIKSEYGFTDDEIILMTEVSENPERIPTKKNVLKAFEWLTKGESVVVGELPQAERLFLHYSGHGSHVKDTSGDEKDGQDEVICLLDSFLLDDDLRKYLVEPLNPASKLTAIFDCCHSGTVLDLKYNYGVNTVISRDGKSKTSFSIDIDNNYADSRGEVVCISGCLDTQYSADAYINGKSQGALTFSILEAHKKLKFLGSGVKCRDLLQSIRQIMKEGRYDQIPQMSSGRMLNLEETFSAL